MSKVCRPECLEFVEVDESPSGEPGPTLELSFEPDNDGETALTPDGIALDGPGAADGPTEASRTKPTALTPDGIT